MKFQENQEKRARWWGRQCGRESLSIRQAFWSLSHYPWIFVRGIVETWDLGRSVRFPRAGRPERGNKQETENNLISGAKFTLPVLCSLGMLPPFINKRFCLLHFWVSSHYGWEVEISWCAVAALVGRPLTSCCFGSGEGLAEAGTVTICCLLRNHFS